MKCAFFLSLLLIPMTALAETPQVPVEGFEWVTSVMTFLLGVLKDIPGVGGVLAAIFGVVSVLAGVMTLVAAFVQGLLAIPELGAHWSGKAAFAEKVKKLSDKILPWLKYFSAFNVQKKK